jgi:signal transduction histidine kinase
MESGTNRMNRLIEEMLAMSAIQSGRLAFHLIPCELGPIVREAVNDQRAQHPQRSIVLDVPDTPVMVLADAYRMGQVVTQYVSNAVKYAPEEQPIIVRLAALGYQVRVTVHDGGPGLPPDEQERIWEAFYQAPGVEAQNGSAIGLGLGLYICRTIVQRHGGQTGVESVAGHNGATFWFTLPLAPTAADAAAP